MTNVKPATDEEIAAMPDRFAAPAEWGGGVTVDEAFSLLARIDADREESARLRAIEADAKSDDGVMGDGYRLRMLVGTQSGEIAALKADQSDWRKGVGFIASALGIDSLSCVDIAERGLEIRAERDALKAEVERLTRLSVPAMTFDPIPGTGRAR